MAVLLFVFAGQGTAGLWPLEQSRQCLSGLCLPSVPDFLAALKKEWVFWDKTADYNKRGGGGGETCQEERTEGGRDVRPKTWSDTHTVRWRPSDDLVEIGSMFADGTSSPGFFFHLPFYVLPGKSVRLLKNSEFSHVAPKCSSSRSVDIHADGIPVEGQAGSSGPDAKRNQGGRKGS